MWRSTLYPTLERLRQEDLDCQANLDRDSKTRPNKQNYLIFLSKQLIAEEALGSDSETLTVESISKHLHSSLVTQEFGRLRWKRTDISGFKPSSTKDSPYPIRLTSKASDAPSSLHLRRSLRCSGVGLSSPASAPI